MNIPNSRTQSYLILNITEFPESVNEQTGLIVLKNTGWELVTRYDNTYYFKAMKSIRQELSTIFTGHIIKHTNSFYLIIAHMGDSGVLCEEIKTKIRSYLSSRDRVEFIG